LAVGGASMVAFFIHFTVLCAPAALYTDLFGKPYKTVIIFDKGQAKDNSKTCKAGAYKLKSELFSYEGICMSAEKSQGLPLNFTATVEGRQTAYARTITKISIPQPQPDKSTIAYRYAKDWALYLPRSAN